LNGVSDWSETWSFTTSSPTSVDEKIIPDQISLEQNYPNPFNPGTKISWQSSVSSHQTLKVYDVLGNEVATLVDEEKSAGSFEIEFDASELSSGIYFYKLTAGTFVETKKMILLR
ncbi:MAG: T9SS type A sorting domain-containing protein, partial [Ignavibacteriaceae bacterium]